MPQSSLGNFSLSLKDKLGCQCADWRFRAHAMVAAMKNIKPKKKIWEDFKISRLNRFLQCKIRKKEE